MVSEEAELHDILHKGSSPARVITRARILTKLAKSHSHVDIHQALETSLGLIGRVHVRFSEGGLRAALGELLRPGPRCKLDPKQSATITAIACSTAPDGHDHWTLRMLAGKVVELGFAESFSHEAARQLLKKTR